METRAKSLTIIISSILLFLSTSTLLSQSQTQTPVPPTPAPSKTAPPNTAQETPTAAEATEDQPPNQAIQVKTQADLNTMTGNIQRPNGIAWFNDKLYTACTGDWTLYEIDTNSGSTVQYLYGVRNAHSIHPILENDQLHLWIPDFQSNTLVHIFQGTSEIVTSNLSGPWGITELDEETFAVSNLSGNNLIAATKTGEAREIISGLRSPSGLANDDSYLYVANTGSTRRAVEWYEKSELLGAESPIDSANLEDRDLITGLQNTTNLTIGPDGFLYFSYALGTRGVVGRVDTEICRAKGGCTSDEVEIVLYTELAAPLAGLTFSDDMKMYIHSIFSPDIYWVQIEPPDPD
jgi:hypothetical protein